MSADPPWFERAIDGPATHAIVIGVSHYPNRPYGLPDLPGSCLAAWSFATWLASPTGYRRDDCPLASRFLCDRKTSYSARTVGNPLWPNDQGNPAAAKNL